MSANFLAGYAVGVVVVAIPLGLRIRYLRRLLRVSAMREFHLHTQGFGRRWAICPSCYSQHDISAAMGDTIGQNQGSMSNPDQSQGDDHGG